MGDEVVYGREGQLRAALAAEAAQLADRARNLVRTEGEDYQSRGGLVEDADRLLSMAREVLRLAVAVERRRGATWDQVGERLEVSKQAARERFTADVEAYERRMLEAWLLRGVPSGRPGLGPGLAGSDPEHAADLDRWLRERGAGLDLGERPVSGALEPMGTAEHGTLLAQAATQLVRTSAQVVDPDPVHKWRREYGYALRRVEWHERMIAEETGRPGRTGTPMDDHRELLAAARARLAEVRAAASAGIDLEAGR
jgi:hypothetical protein